MTTPPPPRRRTAGEILLGLLAATPFLLAGLYVSGVMFMAFVMSVTGVGLPERTLYLVPLPTAAGLALGVVVFRVASRPPRRP